jgi:hypothetical protein
VGVEGFAEQFAANLVRPPVPAVPGDPYAQVLEEHHRCLVAALRRAQRRGEGARSRPRRADGRACRLLPQPPTVPEKLDDWALTAIATIIF